MNDGNISLDSDKFKMYLNHELQDDNGCEAEGKIDSKYTCILNFYKICKTGDVLEVTYSGKTIHTEIC